MSEPRSIQLLDGSLSDAAFYTSVFLPPIPNLSPLSPTSLTTRSIPLPTVSEACRRSYSIQYPLSLTIELFDGSFSDAAFYSSVFLQHHLKPDTEYLTQNIGQRYAKRSLMS